MLEIAVPFAALGLAAGDKFGFTLHTLRGEVEVERLPRYGFLSITVPGPEFEGVHWSA